MTDQNYTHLLMVLDRSGSMQSIVNDANGGVMTLLKEQGEQPGRIVVDIVTFDTVIEWPYKGVQPGDVVPPVIIPRGGTALNDAIGIGVVKLGEELAAMPEDERPGTVIVAVVTDGEENSSREYTHEMVKELVTKQTDQFGWQFVYLAANVDAFETGGSYGFAKGSTMSVAGSGIGTQNAYASMSGKMSATRGSASRGERTAVTFDEKDREAAMEDD